jgi:hypothetical protein
MLVLVKRTSVITEITTQKIYVKRFIEKKD